MFIPLSIVVVKKTNEKAINEERVIYKIISIRVNPLVIKKINGFNELDTAAKKEPVVTVKSNCPRERTKSRTYSIDNIIFITKYLKEICGIWNYGK